MKFIIYNLLQFFLIIKMIYFLIYIMKYLYIYILLATFLSAHNRHSNIPVVLIQPDDSIINCFISGDEYYHWFHDKNNYTIIFSSSVQFFIGLKLFKNFFM